MSSNRNEISTIAKQHSGVIIQESDQWDFIKRANRVIQLNLFSKVISFSFFKPLLSPTGVCGPAVAEWFHYKQENRNFLQELNNSSINYGVINRLQFINKRLENNIAITIQLLKEKKMFEIGGLEHVWLRKMDLVDLEKIYGMNCETCELQTNWLDQSYRSRYSYSVKENNKIEVHYGREENYSHVLESFDAIIESAVSGASLNVLKQIQLLYQTPIGLEGHYIGLTQSRNNNQAQYYFYDPNFGEIMFSSKENCCAFLKDFVKHHFKQYSFNNKINFMQVVTFKHDVHSNTLKMAINQ